MLRTIEVPGRGRGGRDGGRSGRGSNFERGQSSQQNWRGRGRGQRGGRSNHSNFECYKYGKYGHYVKDCNSFKCYNCDKVGHLAKDCRIEKKVEETTNLTLEAEANEGFLLMAQNEINTNDNVWYLDSGASNHMCGHKHLFKEMRKIEYGNVSFGDASKVKVEGKGTIHYLQKDGLIGSIQDVYYVPNLKTNILSLGQLTEKGYSILMKERILHLKDKLGHLIARVEMERNRMYKLNLINVREKCLQVNVEDKASLWHLRFGHLHHVGLKRPLATCPRKRRLFNEDLYLNDTINFLARDIVEHIVIISMNLGTEAYRELLPPQDFVEVPLHLPTIYVLGDCLCFCHHTQKTHFIIWKMKEFGIEKSWTQLLKISYQDLDIRIKYKYFLAQYAFMRMASH
ncbi:hypothetical protein KIW84_032754 [Lathyrus oleraceus]|uniref:CCHC-type domain-containing protein n=1 Tax=Pisum sativum TaxID=3888 RepID=A0A9D5AZ41_PEA|nr:hypothetical protein KIW84_032754 [Pisum sativum]